MNDEHDKIIDLELIETDIRESVDAVNTAFKRAKRGVYNLVLISLLTIMSFILSVNIISIVFLTLVGIVLVYVLIAFLYLNDKKIKLRICVVFLKGMGVITDSNRYILDKHLNRLEPHEYLPSWISVIHNSSIF